MENSNRDLISSASFSGADINVYVMVNPSDIFRKRTDAVNQADVFTDPFLGPKGFEETVISLDSPFSYVGKPGLSGNLSIPPDAGNPRRASALNNAGATIDDYISSVGNITSRFQKLADLQTMSYSIYRDKMQVKSLGQTSAKGFTRGHLTIAGTMIFVLFYEAVLSALFKNSYADESSNTLYGTRIDQLPPLDMFITFTNETGQLSKMGIFGVEFMNEGQAMSIQDLMTENSVNYVARHITRIQAIQRPYVTDEDLFGLQDNEWNRNLLGPEEFMKAKQEIISQQSYFI